ncbi:MAG TPA: hypothetical protein PK516_08965 [Sedimentibacter sp.]|nr:hypothetical protein [Sedimentibacter sp.]HOG63472.1 hypothetical protein [Sedimentibacter sp.]HPY57176.1 hypothetical protein [Sedimentibacter sp.]HQK54191.1 hypothetical protein [Sedimentibacter sp.]HQO72735.1 hypothetical protein [Sedimentibacter sp.]
MKEKKYKSNQKKALIAFITIIIIIAAIATVEKLIEPMGYFRPDYDKRDITGILEKEVLSDDDYKELFYQTGLGKTAVDEILKDKSGKEKILEFQKNFFTEYNISSEKFAVIVNHESLVDEKGKIIYGFDLAPYENGYVLITKATHSLGWRHGHAGIITDAENEETLEAVLLGQDSMLQNINKWRSFPSFIMLKLKDASQEELDKIAEFAKINLLDVPYGLSVGLTSKKNPEPSNITTTQCAHIVWYPFMQFGYDIDSDGTWLVTPKDIANSDLFEIVQIYGVDPDEIWP